tara:strand:+ start:212 stop:394 length:183 start_codon:yes stop_codon:yes gene_type:complete
MSNTLTDNDLKRLAELGKGIKLGLECNINDSGVPCLTDRLDAIEGMKEYLELHDHIIRKK